MVLYIIGLGLCDGKDITVRGLKTIKKCQKAYMENYTSILQASIPELEKALGKSILPIGRKVLETNADELIEGSKKENIALLVPGDPMCATTHISLIARASELNADVRVIHNSSIVSAIGVVGLEVYKYGRITSIPFHNKDVKAPAEAYRKNNSIGLHTLFLLDLSIEEGRFLTIKEASEYLISNGIKWDALAIGCARVGCSDQIIISGKLSEIGRQEYGRPPYCLILPSKLHFMEEESLKLHKSIKY